MLQEEIGHSRHNHSCEREDAIHGRRGILIFFGLLKVFFCGLGLLFGVMDGVFNGINGGLLVQDEVMEESHGFVEAMDVLFEGADGLLGDFRVWEGIGEGSHGLLLIK